MARVLFLAFWRRQSAPSLGIARELTGRGHEFVFAGDPEMMPRMKPTPFRAIELTHAYAQLDKYPNHSPFGRLVLPAFVARRRGADPLDHPRREPGLRSHRLHVRRRPIYLRFSQPSAAMAHMPFFRLAEVFRGLTQMCSGIRQQAGFAALPAFDNLVLSRDRVIVTSLGAIDPARGHAVDAKRAPCRAGA